MIKRDQRFNTSPSADKVQYVDRICSRFPTHCMSGSDETIFGIVAGFPESQKTLVYLKMNERPRKVTTKMQPNCEITRYPQSPATRRFWKALELRASLLFYPLIILPWILPHPYFKHFFFYFQSTLYCNHQWHLLNLMLLRVVSNVRTLYGLEYMSFNVQQLLHLPCLELGPSMVNINFSIRGKWW